ncbi:MAG: GYD domain-containing protein [Proteobacteria bacterium]|nr:GYD domain-containing protein [Pseudomonadota bacterium]
MATYFMFGRYSLDSVKEISPERTNKATALIKKHGGEVESGYALLGEIDLVLIVDLPDTEQAMKTSVALAKLLGISFTTAPAVTVEDFDKIMEEV